MATVLPSEDELVNAVNEILRNNDLEKITLRIVMNMLSQRFECSRDDLASRKRFVRATINDFLENNYDPTKGEPEPTPSKKRKVSTFDENKTWKLTGLEKAVVLAEPLAELIGKPVISRSAIPKFFSNYAKEHGLQDPADKRNIRCDDALKAALSATSFTFFSLNKIISRLVYRPDECSEELQELARKCDEKLLEEKIAKKREQHEKGEVPEGRKGAGKKQKGSKQKAAKQQEDADRPKKPSALSKPMQLSDALVAVCGGATQLPRSEVLKKIWEHIHANELQDPNNRKQILCDDKLKAICDNNASVPHMWINKYLSAHMTKID